MTALELARGKALAPRKPFGKAENFTLVADRELELIESSPNETATERILAASQRRINYYGHAAFNEGELQAILGRHRNTVSNALRSLVARHRIAPESTSLCVILPLTFARRLNRGANMQLCADPGHRRDNLRDRSWLRFNTDFQGWEDQPGQWDALLSEAPTGLAAYEYMARQVAPQAAQVTIVNAQPGSTVNVQNVTVMAPPPAEVPENCYCGMPRAKPAMLCADHLAEWHARNERERQAVIVVPDDMDDQPEPVRLIEQRPVRLIGRSERHDDDDELSA